MKHLRIANVVGARPQFVKLGPVSRAIAAHNSCGHSLQIEEIVVHTGQHYDPALSDVFFRELGLPAPAVNLGVGSGSHAQQTAAILLAAESYLAQARPDAVVVFGDTNTTLAAALAAAKLNQFVVHVEAGLRSGNRRMPEEVNRVAVDHVADLLCAPTEEAMRNLRSEGLSARAVLTGDVMVDTLEFNMSRVGRASGVLDSFGLTPGTYAVATIHRAENTAPATLRGLVHILCEVARDVLPVVFPIHPRTANQLHAMGLALEPRERLMVSRPLGYLDMIGLMAHARVVITDSGGMQKESFCLGVPCVTLRADTEWPETLAAGGNVLVATDRARVLDGVRRSIVSTEEQRRGLAAAARRVYGDGSAGKAVLLAVLRALTERERTAREATGTI